MIFFCFFSSKKKRRGTISFLEEKKQKTLRGRFSFGEKEVSRTSDPIAQKNGRFPYEPSVLCSTLAKKATAAKSNCSADDFLLLPFLSRKKRKSGGSREVNAAAYCAAQWKEMRRITLPCHARRCKRGTRFPPDQKHRQQNARPDCRPPPCRDSRE